MANSTLGDHAVIIMGQSPPGETCSNTTEGLPLLNGPTEYGPHHPVPVQYTTDPRKLARHGDILFCVRGSTGRMNWADRDYAIGRGVAAIRHKGLAVLQPYVRAVIDYSLPSLLAQATGSTFPNVSAGQLAGIWWPELEEAEQLAIAHILGTLDDKIELNRSMNHTLESIARAIFKSWFVDFDPVRAKMEGLQPLGMAAETAAHFPDFFEDSPLGKLPVGWTATSFVDQIDVIGGGTPKTSVPEYWGGNIPWFSVVDTPGAGEVFAIATEKTITDKGVSNSSTRVLPVGTTIISARGTVGNLALVGVPMAMNQSCYGLLDRRGKNGFYLYFAAEAVVDMLRQRSHGSVFNTITRDTLQSLVFVSPPAEVVGAFERQVGVLFQRILTGLLVSKTLVAIRDTLLPKLISGEIRVKDAEKFVEEHVG